MNQAFNKIIDYGFWLLLIGLLAAYFAGVATEGSALAKAVRSLIYAATNRNESGTQYLDYPKNAPSTTTTTTL